MSINLTGACPLTGLPQALSSIQMIIICVGTDVLPALSMVREMPEADLLLRKPRDRKKDRMVDLRIICHAYLFIGVLESLTAMVRCLLLFYWITLISPINFFAIHAVLSILASNAMAFHFRLYG
jgi:magnesium-transporting ATPase (P-type)